MSEIIAPMSGDSLRRVRELEAEAAKLPQIVIPTIHTLHAGVYTRTITIPAGVLVTGVFIKIDTTLIISGDCAVLVGDRSIDYHGYHVITAHANRKQALFAYSDTSVTMFFRTDAETIEQAESEFTDEVDLLFSRNDTAINYINTGGGLCLVEL